MTTKLPRVLTIAAGGAFLDILAENILARFPTFEKDRPLSDWTVLVPTRRAALELAKSLKQKSGAQALVLPRIKPIGDIDEAFLDLEAGITEKPIPLSPQAQLLQLLGLVDNWARENPQIGIAGEISRSAVQRLTLAKSLSDLIETVETNECSFDKLQDAYEADLSDHRTSILSLLDLLKYRLPTQNHEQGHISAIEYRNRTIRSEAARIASGKHQGPIIAAGSTGTIPSTRALLKAIASHPQGAVILPGLDQFADANLWDKLPQEHPQYSMKLLLAEMELKPSDVSLLGPTPNPRCFLASELMRPAITTEAWHLELPLKHDLVEQAIHGLTEISAPDRHLEARSIAVIMRHALYEKQTAALITPNRDLAARVKAELQRWNIEIADTAGLKLANFSHGNVFDLLLETVRDQFSIATVMALISQSDVTLGFDPEIFPALRQVFEFACLRGNPFLATSTRFEDIARMAELRAQKAYRNHPLVDAMPPETWANVVALGVKIDSVLVLFSKSTPEPFIHHINTFANAIKILCPGAEEQRALTQFFTELQEAAHYHPVCTLYEAALTTQHLLRAAPQPPSVTGHSRLAIYGTLEARLMEADIVILGGLNETVWPAPADPGPWLNRNMRDLFGLPHPERDIGLSAHDFEQGFCAKRVYLTSSQRIGTAPATQSRWLLRLKAVLAAAKVEFKADANFNVLALASALDASGPMKAHGKPAFAPPVKVRPTKFSVTEIEKLVRNPYAIYANRILNLEPLENFGAKLDAALRGSVFHDALAQWNKANIQDLSTLLNAGEDVFKAYAISPETKRFWWPHFMRAATWLVVQELDFEVTTQRIFSEINGELNFKIESTDFKLTARADRIDLLKNGAARIIDYKTGKPPTQDQVETFLSPQLTLEAAMVLAQGFKGIPSTAIAEILYLRLGGGRAGLKKQEITAKDSLEQLAKTHLAHLKMLLGLYLEPSQPYLPRLRIEKDRSTIEYDHLSRYLEWQLAGAA
jgi:ATP-dependent helicase/nuclease subunit B